MTSKPDKPTNTTREPPADDEGASRWGDEVASRRGDEVASRRGFVWRLGVALGGLAVLEYIAVAAAFLRPHRNRGEEGGGIIEAGPVGRFEPNTVTAFPRGKFYLARLEDGGFLALSRECTHLGCTVPWIAEEQRFVCPCHASSFGIDGAVASPPAPRPLDTYAVRIENHIVKVDVSRPIERGTADRTQVTRP